MRQPCPGGLRDGPELKSRTDERYDQGTESRQRSGDGTSRCTPASAANLRQGTRNALHMTAGRTPRAGGPPANLARARRRGGSTHAVICTHSSRPSASGGYSVSERRHLARTGTGPSTVRSVAMAPPGRSYPTTPSRPQSPLSPRDRSTEPRRRPLTRLAPRGGIRLQSRACACRCRIRKGQENERRDCRV